MVELQEILDSEPLILMDWSVRNISRKAEESFVWNLYEAKKYSYLKNKTIERGLEELDYFLYILEQPNTFTIEAITKEVKDLEKILSQKINFLSLPCLSKPSIKSIKKRAIESQKKEELLKNLQEKAYNLCRISKRKEIPLNSSDYESLLEMTKLIESTIKLKKDVGYTTGEHGIDRAVVSDTDEKLVATLYWLSLYNKKPSLLSGDGDFISLLWIVTRLICSDSFLPYNKEFREKIRQNPFKLFFKKMNSYSQKIISSEIKYDKKFRIGKIDCEKNLEIEEKIFGLWKSL